LNILNYWLECTKKLVSKPTEFFNEVEEHNSIGSALSFSAVSGLVFGLLTGILYGGFSLISGDLEGLALIVSAPIAGALIAPIGLLINAAFIHLIVYLFGGRGYTRTTEAISYATVSQALLGWIPVLGGFLAGIYLIFLEVKGLKRFHNLSTGKALVASLFPIIVSLGLFFVLMIMLAGAITGLAGSPPAA